MSRLQACLANLAAEDKKALTTFITAADPAATVPALLKLAESGADILELGVPFSDPEAEGPVIQASSERGLANGITLTSCLDMVAEFREANQHTPIVLMGYLNSILAMGYGGFAEAAADAGVDGLILVNLPPEEAAPLKKALALVELDLVFLIAPTTTDERCSMIIGEGSGFLYYVSLKGITGADHLDVEPVADRVRRIKSETPLPVLVGFGIKDGATARTIAQHADGVVVGSALVRTMAEFDDETARLERLETQVADFRSALDGR